MKGEKEMKKILSFVMAAMMVVMMLPAVVGAAEPVVAADLEALQAAIEAGETDITLTGVAELTTGEVVIEAEKPVTITTAVEDAFTVTGGTLTLGKNITVECTNSAIWVAGGEVVVDGAVINVRNAVHNAVAVWTGKLTVKSGEINQYDTDYATVVARKKYTDKDAGVVEILGGKIYSEKSTALAARASGEVYINGGEVVTVGDEFCAAYACGNGKIVMNAGTVSSDTGYGLVACSYGEGAGTVVVNGGTVEGGVKSHEDAASSVTINGGEIEGAAKADGAVLVINGGTFSEKPDDEYLADGVEFALVNGEYVACTHIYGEWYRDGKVMVRNCVKCGAAVTAPLTSAERVKDQIRATMMFLMTQKYDVVVDANEGGTVSVDGKATYRYNADVKITVKADEGYEVESVIVDGVEQTNTSLVSIKNIKADHEIVVTFAKVETEEEAIAEEAVVEEAIVEEAAE